MTRTPKTAEQHRYEGTYRADRQPDDTLQTHGRPLRPEYFADHPSYCKAWTDILRSGPWLTESDSETVERMAVALASWRDYVRDGVPTDNAAFYRMLSCGKTFDTLAAKCGLNPADRQRIRGQKAEKKTTKGRFFEN